MLGYETKHVEDSGVSTTFISAPLLSVFFMPCHRKYRIQERSCIFCSIISQLPVMRRAYVALIVLAIVFSMA